MAKRILWAVLWAAASAAGVAFAQAPAPRDAVCLSCHAVPSAKFHSQPSHKKLTCGNCHVGGPEHVADTRVRPKLGGDDKLCASCHAPKKKHGGN